MAQTEDIGSPLPLLTLSYKLADMGDAIAPVAAIFGGWLFFLAPRPDSREILGNSLSTDHKYPNYKSMAASVYIIGANVRKIPLFTFKVFYKKFCWLRITRS